MHARIVCSESMIPLWESKMYTFTLSSSPDYLKKRGKEEDIVIAEPN